MSRLSVKEAVPAVWNIFYCRKAFCEEVAEIGEKRHS